MATDPKYQFGETNEVLHREGGYLLPTDEPVVLFRGKDVGTLVALAAYQEFMEFVADNTPSDHARAVAVAHAKSIGERLDTIRTFQDHHPERTGLGCHTCPPGIAPHDIRQHLEQLYSQRKAC